ncbi:MAG: UDP-N-acetylmuramate dehydrogenase [Phycisphaerales bacterium JB050]
MSRTLYDIIEFHKPIDTWFGVGGGADRYARPADREELTDCLIAYAGHTIRIFGDGANLLVHDDGIDGIVLDLADLDACEYSPGETPDEIILHAQAGANLPRLIVESVREGYAGLESLAGIPATIGGAVIMNAGGAFGSISELVSRVHALTMTGAEVVIPADQISFDYRHSGLEHLVITSVELRLRKVSEKTRPALRNRLKEVMAYKKKTQPMAERSAGCCFKNPLAVASGLPGAGVRVSAGKLIDEAGCKGLRIGGAEVSDRHANFIITHEGCLAQDIIDLMNAVEKRVYDFCGVRLEREVRVWQRSE